MELNKVYDERRSVNFFDKNRGLDDNLLKDIVNLAVLAPSAFNLQPWEIIVVKTKEAKEKLLKLSNNQDKVVEAPVTLIIVGDKNGYDKSNPVWTEMLETLGGNKEAVEGAQGAAGFLYGTSEERKLKFAESNGGLLAMSLMYAAQSFGVDSHPMSGIDFDGIKKEFGLADNKSVVMTIALGYFDKSKTLYPRRPRRGYADIVKEV
jgi:putative NAD(P)H nitroreductase